MNLSQLYYFRELARAKSYKRAAANCFISEPTLSIAVKKLEQELGTELLTRKRNYIELTEDGQDFAACLEQSLGNIDEHAAAIKAKAKMRNQTLRLGIVFSLQQRVWMPLVNEFWIEQNRNPDTVIKQGTTEQLLHSLKTNEVDVVISGVLGDDDALQTYPLWSSRAFAAINTANPLSLKESVTFDDIRPYELITYADDSPMGPESHRLAEDHQLNPHFEYRNEPSICANVAGRPDTIGIVCDSWLAYSTAGVNIVPISDSPESYHRFWLIHRANPPKCQTLLREFVDFAQGFDYTPYL
jgi:DNA-binding transcriptional LysR family regulator